MIAEQYQFHQRSQRPGKSVANYIAELRKLALHCEFNKFLNDALQDRLVCGLRNAAAQKQLLSQTEPTLDKALRLAQGMEAAKESTKKLQGGDSSFSSSINHAGVTRDSQVKLVVVVGNSTTFPALADFANPSAISAIKGHLARVCHSTPKGQDQSNSSSSTT